MAVEPDKIRSMMAGRTLTKENIKKMYDMVQNAEDTDEKKQVMKHSVFFAGQLPLLPGYEVDTDQTKKLLLASVPYDEIEEYTDYLFDGLATQKLLLKKGDRDYQINSKYENPVAKATKVARAFQVMQAESRKDRQDTLRKVYQDGTKYYNAGRYEEAYASFKKAAQGGHRMACYSLALLYKDGKGVERDLKKALFYACKALAQGALIADPLTDELIKALG